MKLQILASSSGGNCYLLQGDNEVLIIECGVSYKKILKSLDFNLGSIVGCLVSHEHKDHSKSINDLIKNGVNIYTSKGTAEAYGATGYRIKHIKSEEQFKIGGFTILPFETQHDAREPLGFLIYHKDIGKLLFATDTYYIKYKFSGLNHILVECNYSNPILDQNIADGKLPASLRNRIIRSHFSLDNVKEFFKATDLKEVRNIVLIHLSDGNSNAKEFKDTIEKTTGKVVTIAAKGVELDVGINPF